MKKIFNYTKRHLQTHKWRLIIYIAISIIISISALISPYIIGDFIDQLTNANNLSFIYRYFFLFAGINITTLLLGYISGQLYIKIQTRLGYALNREIIQKLQHAPINYTSKQDTVYLNQRINSDANALIIFCIGIIQNILVNIVILAVSLGLIIYFHPPLAGVLMVVSIIYFTFYVLYKKRLYKASHAFKESQATYFSKLNEQLFNIRFIKLHSLFGHFIGRLNRSFDGLLKTALVHQRTGYIFGGLDRLVSIAAQMVLLLFGGREIIAGRLTIGRFIIISSYFTMMLGAIRYFFSLGQTVQNNMVSYNRLRELDAIDPELNGKMQLNEVHSIELKNVSFAYGENGTDSTKPLLVNKTLTFTKGKIHILLGPNGAGKSTLADIIMGLQNGNYTGQVLYNGIPMEDIDMYDLRSRHMGVSEQEPVLLPDTLLYNLELGGHGEPVGGGDDLTKILGLDTFIQTLPNGLETVINENAANISGGEKQKISILRALLKNPDVLVLDEPTSALDGVGKAALRRYLEGVAGERIIIVVTHDREFVDWDNDNVVAINVV